MLEIIDKLRDISYPLLAGVLFIAPMFILLLVISLVEKKKKKDAVKSITDRLKAEKQKDEETPGRGTNVESVRHAESESSEQPIAPTAQKKTNPLSLNRPTAPASQKNTKPVPSSQPADSAPKPTFTPITPDPSIIYRIFDTIRWQLPVDLQKHPVDSDAFWTAAFRHYDEYDAVKKAMLLCCACRAFRTQEINRLLANGADPNTCITVTDNHHRRFMHESVSGEITPFLFFCVFEENNDRYNEDSYLGILQKMISCGADPGKAAEGWFYYDEPGNPGTQVAFHFSTKEIIEYFHPKNAEKILGSICHKYEIRVFGAYPQLSENEKTPVEWLVLEKVGNRELLLSKYALDYKSFSGYGSGTAWEESDTRQWLNSEFWNAAFSAEEQKRIVSVKRDKIFLLSVEEANKYFSSNIERQCSGTEYCFKRGAQKCSGERCFWLLRSTNKTVDDNGRIREETEYDRGVVLVPNFSAVRPAMWVRL
ncbi:MAG: DUF6273 domain-containing protein [Clostridia bacterium]|nr:DUF6273 domain-containing protein [Clostridia bacterium]